ncbi:hypothetical protein [Bacillus pinisoli]|uniref:hypothetical protein n=1 Tax=Bacillus pinisoli TaxID=2901866 RepID=UPI001FF41DF6|nr:hypothetical protein [Bacillus pinisoli]
MDLNMFLNYELAKQKQSELQRQLKFNETYHIQHKQREKFCMYIIGKKICF